MLCNIDALEYFETLLNASSLSTDVLRPKGTKGTAEEGHTALALGYRSYTFISCSAIPETALVTSLAAMLVPYHRRRDDCLQSGKLKGLVVDILALMPPNSIFLESHSSTPTRRVVQEKSLSSARLEVCAAACTDA